jgi:tryptophanyl-tRNA synthetase
MSKLVISGVKPTGEVHIGNYFGAIKQFIDFQNNTSNFDSRYFIADLHAMTTVSDSKALKRSILDIVKTYLAVGLDRDGRSPKTAAPKTIAASASRTSSRRE